MPEFPEVETVRRQLNETISGYTVGELWFDAVSVLRPNPEKISVELTGKKILSVDRKGKWIVINFEDTTSCLVIHLKLTGRLFVKRIDEKQAPYTHVILGLARNTICSFSENNCDTTLQFSTMRKFGYLEVMKKAELMEKFSNLGPDFYEDVTLNMFADALASRKIAIKTLLMNQDILSGIGNIYANDALWMAKIDPQTKAHSLDKGQREGLFTALKEVLAEGLALGGASDQWFLNVFGEKGGYQNHFKVYGKKGTPCTRCGNEIKYTKIAGRGTYYCSSCQHNL
ncbi:bifunctional DNA-formamidopyrimidine glycosylase/DNA-(apurinic or apyrimidinic site) lyase [candidate division WWE3 bacterium]|uniref:Bifunctional DNA-formamidopyrimidine glycosylase/DNA-(Apurinic or apyrimidinic site) lyase n=1 Tax=candidate division WWE3 bacterium TaxID=2053526 RepID=A0A955RQK5_UNCKA|nr:bifunctional DNA-formamidopyrimidine glycosylase/DNA-(apurinic or apyrimidinic site) lyase [candidate division WWE3 bacterium]